MRVRTRWRTDDPTTKVQWSVRRRLHHGERMLSNRFLGRRTLRSSMSLVEGAVWRRSDLDTVLVEVSGGPPSCPLEVTVAGCRRQLDLDARGCGVVRLDAPNVAAPVIVRHQGIVILDGTTPATPRLRRARAGRDLDS